MHLDTTALNRELCKSIPHASAVRLLIHTSDRTLIRTSIETPTLRLFQSDNMNSGM